MIAHARRYSRVGEWRGAKAAAAWVATHERDSFEDRLAAAVAKQRKAMERIVEQLRWPA